MTTDAPAKPLTCWQCGRNLALLEGTITGKLTLYCKRCKAKNPFPRKP